MGGAGNFSLQVQSTKDKEAEGRRGCNALNISDRLDVCLCVFNCMGGIIMRVGGIIILFRRGVESYDIGAKGSLVFYRK